MLFTLVLLNWDNAVALDLHEMYGLDHLDPGFAFRPWWDTRNHILGLLDKPTRLAAMIGKGTS